MQFQRTLKPQISLDLTPLIDVVFQLVIFFMVAMVFNTSPGLELQLPSSETSETISMDELRITLVSEEEIYLNKELVSWDMLEEKLDSMAPLIVEQQKSVIIEGDKAVPYDIFIRTLDILRFRGIQDVGLITIPGDRP
ncbi:MAG: biopolymer transporter ExbD [Spirochaetaceae bacterium]|jgi:biopolymer transport protein ExbD|nr:biopolymer transporter ExbD [Spirochaetaceae bacterium]